LDKNVNPLKKNQMARVKSKIIELSGKVGGLVFSSTIYGPLVREAPYTPRKKRKPTILQKFQQEKMQVVMGFLQPLQHLLRDTMFPPGSHLPPFHWAKSYYMNEAVYFENETYHILFSKALMSVGDLRPPELISAHVDDTHRVELQWQDNSEQALAYPDDGLLVILCAPQAKALLYQTDVAKRSEQGVTITLNEHWEGVETHLWAGFSQPGKRASASVYVGSFTL